MVAAIRPVRGKPDLAAVSTLFVAYAESLNFDLCFQGFDQELATLPGNYAPPGGELWLAGAVGCVAVRPLDGGDCEMKRLYVRPDARGTGLGRRLAETAIQFAVDRGYARMKLDTISTEMATAVRMYRALGFRETEAYYANPVEGATYYSLDLPRTSCAPSANGRRRNRIIGKHPG